MKRLGIIGSMVWRPQRVWLQTVDHQTHVISDDATFDPSQLDPAAAKARRVQVRWLIGLVWIVWTGWLVMNIIAIYPRAASLTQPGSPIHALLGAWLIFSGGVIARRARIQLALLGVGVAIIVLGLI